MTKKNEGSFEQNMVDIEKIIDTLHKKEMTLEHSLALFEQGTRLIRTCQHTLSAAEQQISIVDNE